MFGSSLDSFGDMFGRFGEHFGDMFGTFGGTLWGPSWEMLDSFWCMLGDTDIQKKHVKHKCSQMKKYKTDTKPIEQIKRFSMDNNNNSNAD